MRIFKRDLEVGVGIIHFLLVNETPTLMNMEEFEQK